MLFSFSHCKLPSQTSGCLILLTKNINSFSMNASSFHGNDIIRNVKPLETRSLSAFWESRSTKKWSISSVKMHLQKLTLQSDPSEWKLQPIVRIEKMCFCGINWAILSHKKFYSIQPMLVWLELRVQVVILAGSFNGNDEENVLKRAENIFTT